MAEFERVVDLADWYDGPRQGVAHFGGRLYAFQSRMLDVFGDDEAIDLFDLTSVEAGAPSVVARAEFRRIGSGPLPAGEWPALEVLWTPVGADGA